MSKLPLTASQPAPSGNLTAVQFQQLAEVPFDTTEPEHLRDASRS